MNDGQESFPRPRRVVLPPLSSRTLHHPSFMSVYAAAGSVQQPIDSHSQTGPPMAPAEFFYTDPTVGHGGRIPNLVSTLRGFERFHLNTPPPIMSSCPVPPSQPDPFRSGPTPTINLGSASWRMEPVVLPSRVILQLTLEEDQAITNLLKLHHQEPLQRQDGNAFIAPQGNPSGVGESLEDDMNMEMDFSLSISHPELMDLTPIEEIDEFCNTEGEHPWVAILGSQLHQGRLWSDVELEAAKTLLTCLSLSDPDGLWEQNQHRPAETHPALSLSAEIPPVSETLPALISGVSFDSAQTNVGYTTFSCVGSCNCENGEPVWAGSVESSYVHHVRLLCHEDHLALPLPISSSPPSSLSSDSEVESGPGAFGDLLRVKGGTLSESEGTAVQALLILGDRETPDAQFVLKP
ncbi:uncharacterized protein LOC115376600 isoform X2 [Myripristis murdjan]|uniref:uncharacterized protein LOC115376600 isoform X2 n=1 Tax=Myripristis murdjan TaxID=586833 RepID=UPI001175F6B3|nr:uncharacterized protein LOC115376600 isoform X2 [Myripristis murdjan]XP_029932158.1 uncharacterized protein LOC115376600 isoform X2 [Myripristis murdjan]